MLYFLLLAAVISTDNQLLFYFQKLSSTAKINGRQFILERMRYQND